MRILFVLPVKSYRGAEKVISSLAEEICENNEIHILYLKKVQIEEEELNPKIKTTTPSGLLNKLLQNNYVYTVIAPLYALIQTLKFADKTDYIATDSFPCLYSAVIAAKIKNKKIVWFIHSLEPQPYPQTSLLGKWYFHTIHKLNLIISNHIDIAITNSPKVSRHAKNLYPELNVKEITPPVSTFQDEGEEYNPISKYNLFNKKIGICVGELHPLKNQALALAAWSEVIKNVSDCSLIFIGGGNPQQLIIMQKQLKIPDTQIIFTGQINQKKLYEWYKVCDIVLQTAYYPEGLGLSPFEGLLHKKMPIVVEGSGASEIIKENRIGIVVPQQKKLLAKAIVAYLLNPAEYEYTLDKGYQYVTHTMTKEIYSKAFIQTIQNL